MSLLKMRHKGGGAEADASLTRAIADCGRELGMVIQIVNDYLGVWKPALVAKYDGGSKGQVYEEDELLPQYYRARGWDERGVPTREMLAQLKLGFAERA